MPGPAQPPVRIAIVGNSGSGKSTLARRLHEERRIPLLELDSIVWEPGKVAVLRDKDAFFADLDRFLADNDSWIVEGCYGELIEHVLARRPQLLFLNPGEEACVENNRSRPWEPHKYASKEAQDEKLEFLLSWVRDYYKRDGQWSFAAHRKLYDAYAGPKEEVTEQAERR